MIRVFLVDDHAVLRQGLHLLLETASDIDVIGEAGTGQEALLRIPSLYPDVVLLDVHLPDIDGLQLARKLGALVPRSHIVMLTVSDRPQDVKEALHAGVRGYLLKSASADEVVDTIRQVMMGGIVLPPPLTARLIDDLIHPAMLTQELTEREEEVLHYIVRGLSNKEIATAMGLSENTVKTHVRKILTKLNARSRAEAAAFAVRTGLVST